MMNFYGILLAIGLLTLSGCERQDKSLSAEDETNPNIRQALSAQRDRNFTEAAKGYEAALQATPTLSRAHFELGLLYADRLNDPISAMYHFQAYIKQRPDAENREGAEKRLNSIKVQFAATVPNSPIQNAEAFAKLLSDNQNLLKELDDTRATLAEIKSKTQVATDPSNKSSTLPPTPVAGIKDTPDAKNSDTTTTPGISGADTATAPTTVSDSPIKSVAINPPNPTGSLPAAPQPAPTPPSPAPVPEVKADRSYTVAQGDTLWKIARNYYPSQINAGIEKIKKANADKLPDGKPLKIGTVLLIP